MRVLLQLLCWSVRLNVLLLPRILYQRNIYPAEDFKMVKKYGLNMLVSTDDSLQSYLRKIMSQLNGTRRLFIGYA